MDNDPQNFFAHMTRKSRKEPHEIFIRKESKDTTITDSSTPGSSSAEQAGASVGGVATTRAESDGYGYGKKDAEPAVNVRPKYWISTNLMAERNEDIAKKKERLYFGYGEVRDEKVLHGSWRDQEPFHGELKLDDEDEERVLRMEKILKEGEHSLFGFGGGGPKNSNVVDQRN